MARRRDVQTRLRASHLSMTKHLDITVSPILQQNATPEDLANHIDIADWLIRTRCSAPVIPGSSKNQSSVIPGLTRDLTAEERHRQHVISNFESTYFGKGKSTDFRKVKSTP